MTRNQELLLIMSWARSFHGIGLDNCVMIAERVIDSFSGSVADANPISVIEAFDKFYFEANSAGEVPFLEDGHVPAWEDYDCVRPPQVMGGAIGSGLDTGVVLSDNTCVFPQSAVYEPLELLSGGVVPILEEAKRDVVLPIVFSDPAGITQEKINTLAKSPPKRFSPTSYVEEMALSAYRVLKAQVPHIDPNLYIQNDEHGHSHFVSEGNSGVTIIEPVSSEHTAIYGSTTPNEN